MDNDKVGHFLGHSVYQKILISRKNLGNNLLQKKQKK